MLQIEKKNNSEEVLRPFIAQVIRVYGENGSDPNNIALNRYSDSIFVNNWLSANFMREFEYFFCRKGYYIYALDEYEGADYQRVKHNLIELKKAFKGAAVQCDISIDK